MNNIENIKGKFEFWSPVREPKIFTVYVSYKKLYKMYKNTMFKEKEKLISWIEFVQSLMTPSL